MSNVAEIRKPEKTGDESGISRTVDRSRASDVVVGFVAYAGSGNNYIAKQLKSILEGGYSRKVCIIKASELIRDHAIEKGYGSPGSVTDLQNAGDSIRALYKDASAVAALFIREVHRRRAEGFDTFVFDSIKRKEEIGLLRRIYADSAIIIGVGCNPKIRRKRLATKLRLSDEGDDAVVLDKIIERDISDKENKKNGQEVIKAFHLSDYFIDNSISNENDKEYRLPDKLKDFAELIFTNAVKRPSRDEKGMYMANSAALRSSCLSRQVGASILNKEGTLIAVGVNEVPSYGGGTYNEENDLGKQRCFHKGVCSNTKQQNEVSKEIFEKIKGGNFLKDGLTEDGFIELISSTRVGALIEFSRAVHAEMDAIISVARKGGRIDDGCILYTTTYPCHSCARHIVAAGIERVVFLEPYQKSLALELHGDSISEGGDADKKVKFEPYQGVSPRLYEKVYRKNTELKDGKTGIYIVPNDGQSAKRSLFKLSFTDLEEQVCKAIEGGGQ